MPETRNQEIEQLKAQVAELRNLLTDEAASHEVQHLRDQVADLRSRINQGPDIDLYRIPDPIKFLSEFSGNKKELNAWLEEVDELFQAFKVKGENGSPDTLNSAYLRAIKNKIKGDARTQLCANGNPNTIPGIKKVLLEQYGDQHDIATNLSALFHVRKGEQGQQKFFNTVKEVNTKLKANLQTNPLSACELIEMISVTKYLDNIGEPLASIIRSKGPKNLEDAYHFVVLNQNAEHRTKPITKYKPQWHNNTPRGNNDEGRLPKPKQTFDKNSDRKPNVYRKPQPFKKPELNRTETACADEKDSDDDDDEDYDKPSYATEESDTAADELNFQTAYFARRKT